MAGKLTDKAIIHLALVIMLGIAVYSNTFGVPFQFDDVSNIVENPLIKDASNIPSLFKGGSGPFASRPLLHATVAFNYYLDGMDTWGYHAFNLALHLINAVLLYFLVMIIAGRLGRAESEGRLAALFSSLLFVAHPVQTEAVTYIISRSVLLATTFYLSGIILFFRAVTSERRKGAWIAGLSMVSLLGMASRENFAMFPVALLIFDLLFISRLSVKQVARHYMAYFPVLATLGYMVFLAANNTYARSPNFPGWGIEPIQYVLTQVNAHFTYLRLLVLPVNQNVAYDYPVAASLLEPPAFVSLAAYVGLWAGAVMLARKWPVFSFGTLWFFVALVPASFAVAFMGLLLGDPIFEHRVYLPSAGAITALALGMTALARRREAFRKASVYVLVALVAVFSVASYVRNDVWRNEISLWEDAAQKAPMNDVPYGNLGAAYAKEGMAELADRFFRLQMKLHRERRQYMRGGSSGNEGPAAMSHVNVKDVHPPYAQDTDTAIKQYEAAVETDPGDVTAHNMLGVLYKGKGMTDKAIEHYEASLRLEPGNAEVRNNLANIYDSIGRTEEAIGHYKEAIRVRPDYAVAHFNLGVAYYNSGLRDRAAEEMEKALEIDPSLARAREALEQLR